jgi:alpha-beta hydrolase superfamily lysophospholipase
MDGTLPAYGLVDHLGVAHWLFYPRPDTSPPPPGAVDRFVEVPGARIDYDALATAFSQLGIALSVADYRGYGASSGTPSFASLFTDAHAVWQAWLRWLEELAAPGPRFVYGRSLGGYPALELAATYGEAISGLVLESSAANLGRLVRRFVGEPLGPLAELVRAHDARIEAVNVPVLFIHGERDELIPLEAAADLYHRLPSREKDFVVIPNAGHNDILWVGAEAYFSAISHFVQRCLRRS